MSRHRIADTRTTGPSKTVPFIEGEMPNARHERRKAIAREMQDGVQQWCDDNNAELIVTNEGHHWRILLQHGEAEWWPSSAKLVLDKQYDRGIHVHDAKQLIRQLDLRRQ